MNNKDKQEEIENKIKMEIRNGDCENLSDRETPAEEAQRIKDEDIEPPK